MMGVFVALAETTVPIIRVPRRWPTARTYSPIGYVLEESRVNLLRGGTITAKNAAKTHCPQGHSYTPENTYRRANGARHCRRCVLAQQKAARVARRGA